MSLAELSIASSYSDLLPVFPVDAKSKKIKDKDKAKIWNQIHTRTTNRKPAFHSNVKPPRRIKLP